MQLDTTQTDTLAKRSRRAAVVVLVVFLVLAAVIGRNVMQLNALENQIGQRQDAVSKLEERVTTLQEEVYSLRYAPEDTINVRAHAEPIPGIMENGQQVKDFTIWIDLSTYRRKTLKRVTYRVVDQAAPFETRVADNVVNGFAISYRGTSCIDKMALDVEFTDGTNESIDFDMCQSLAR